jgi:hypothetical protein
MHIAHFNEGDLLSVEVIAELTGLKRRQIANLARQMKIPGVSRPNGYHYQYELTADLRCWIEEKQNRVEKRKLPNAPGKQRPTDTGLASIHSARMMFDIWLRKIGGLDGILGLPPESIRDVMVEIRPIAMLYFQIEEGQKSKLRRTFIS